MSRNFDGSGYVPGSAHFFNLRAANSAWNPEDTSPGDNDNSFICDSSLLGVSSGTRIAYDGLDPNWKDVDGVPIPAFDYAHW